MDDSLKNQGFDSSSAQTLSGGSNYNNSGTGHGIGSHDGNGYGCGGSFSRSDGTSPDR